MVGGAVSTVQRWPGYRVDRGSSAHVMVRHTGIVEDLALDVTYLDLDPWGVRAVRGRPAASLPDRPRPDLLLDRERLRRRGTPTPTAPSLSTGRPRNRGVFDAFQHAPTPRVWARRPGALGTRHRPRRRRALPPVPDERRRAARRALRRRAAQDRACPGWARSPARRRTSPPPPTSSAGTPSCTCCHRSPRGRKRCAERGPGPAAPSYGGTVRLGDGAQAIVRTGDRVTGVRHRQRGPPSAPTSSSRAATSSPPWSCSVTGRCSSEPDGRCAWATASGWWCGSRRGASRRTRGRRRTCTALCSSSLPAGRPCAARTASSSPACPRPSLRRLPWASRHGPDARSCGQAPGERVGAVAPLRPEQRRALGRHRPARGGQARRHGRPRSTRLRRPGGRGARADAAGPRARAGAASRAGHAPRDEPGPDVLVAPAPRARGAPGRAGRRTSAGPRRTPAVGCGGPAGGPLHASSSPTAAARPGYAV